MDYKEKRLYEFIVSRTNDAIRAVRENNMRDFFIHKSTVIGVFATIDIIYGRYSDFGKSVEQLRVDFEKVRMK